MDRFKKSFGFQKPELKKTFSLGQVLDVSKNTQRDIHVNPQPIKTSILQRIRAPANSPATPSKTTEELNQKYQNLKLDIDKIKERRSTVNEIKAQSARNTHKPSTSTSFNLLNRSLPDLLSSPSPSTPAVIKQLDTSFHSDVDLKDLPNDQHPFGQEKQILSNLHQMDQLFAEFDTQFGSSYNLLDQKEQECENLKEKNEELQNDVEKSHLEIERLKKILKLEQNKTEKLHLQSTKFKQQLEDQYKGIIASNNSISEIKKEREEQAMEITDLKLKNSEFSKELETERKEKQKVFGKLKKSLEIVKKLTNQIKSIRKDTNLNSKLQEKVQELKNHLLKQIEENEVKIEEIKEMKSSFKELQLEIAKKESKLKDKKEKLKENEEKNAKIDEKVQKLRQTVTSLVAQNKSLKSFNLSLRKEIKAKQAEEVKRLEEIARKDKSLKKFFKGEIETVKKSFEKTQGIVEMYKKNLMYSRKMYEKLLNNFRNAIIKGNLDPEYLKSIRNKNYSFGGFEDDYDDWKYDEEDWEQNISKIESPNGEKMEKEDYDIEDDVGIEEQVSLNDLKLTKLGNSVSASLNRQKVLLNKTINK